MPGGTSRPAAQTQAGPLPAPDAPAQKGGAVGSTHFPSLAGRGWKTQNWGDITVTLEPQAAPQEEDRLCPGQRGGRPPPPHSFPSCYSQEHQPSPAQQLLSSTPTLGGPCPARGQRAQVTWSLTCHPWGQVSLGVQRVPGGAWAAPSTTTTVITAPHSAGTQRATQAQGRVH